MIAFSHGFAGRLGWAVVLLGLASAAPARAELLVTFQFEGVISRSTSPLVQVGDRFSGTFTYDLEAIDELPGSPEFGFYSFELPQPRPVGMSYTAGSFSHSSQFLVDVLVFNDFFGDTLSLLSDGLQGPGFFPSMGEIFLDDPTGTALSSDRPPATLDLAAFSTRTFVGNIAPGSFFEGEIQTLTFVPEPGTLTLLGVGAVLLFGARRLRRRAAPA